ncbi:hypothetical protein K438DRAFT_1975782 [Mycena galopus ATCC 62051]|nr:hypothetical protein K438DRAFT_1975782 [Mycena galopus ATCC 62051]
MPAPAELLKWIDSSSDAFIWIPPPHAFRMSDWLNAQLQAVGVTTKQVERPDAPLPAATLGRMGYNASKKTVLIYGHFDVQPASLSDGWTLDPFRAHAAPRWAARVARGITRRRRHFRSTWYSVSERGLDELVAREAMEWFKGVDCVCISNNYWLNTRARARLRSRTVFVASCTSSSLSLAPGATSIPVRVFGRTVHEPMTDLIALMGQLVSPDDKILVPGVDDMVTIAGAEERAIYEKLDHSIADVEDAAGAKVALSADKVGGLRSCFILTPLALTPF